MASPTGIWPIWPISGGQCHIASRWGSTQRPAPPSRSRSLALVVSPLTSTCPWTATPARDVTKPPGLLDWTFAFPLRTSARFTAGAPSEQTVRRQAAAVNASLRPAVDDVGDGGGDNSGCRCGPLPDAGVDRHAAFPRHAV